MLLEMQISGSYSRFTEAESVMMEVRIPHFEQSQVIPMSYEVIEPLPYNTSVVQ